MENNNKVYSPPETIINPLEEVNEEDLDDEWTSELREEEKNLEKEIERQQYANSGINLRNRFVYCSIVSALFLGPGLTVYIFDKNYGFGNAAPQLKLTTILYFLGALPISYFVASLIAALIKFLLSQRKENTRLLVFYFSKMQTYVVYAIAGAISSALLPTFMAIWQSDTIKDPKYNNLVNAASTFCYWITAWGIVQLAGIILFRSFSIKFHKSAYYDRVLQALFTEYVLVMLSRPVSKKQHRRRKSSYESAISSDDINSYNDGVPVVKIDKIPIKEKELITRHVGNIRLAEFVNFLQETPYFLVHSAEFQDHDDKTLDLNLKAMGKSVQKNVLGLLKNAPIKRTKSRIGGVSMALSARKLGHRLFYFLKDDKRDVIVQEDFGKYLNDQLVEEAFLLFDKNFDGSLDYREFVSTLNDILKERKAISDSLNDAEKALSKLESVFFSCFCLIWFFVAIFLSGADVQSTFVSLTSFVVGFAFLFGPVVKSIIDGVIFVFVSHPFDISDKIAVTAASATLPTIYTVIRLNMYNTVLKRSDNASVIFPNSELAKMTIVNLTKSPNMLDIVKFNINTDTAVAKVKEFEKLLKRFLMLNAEHYYEAFEVSLNKCENYLEVDVRISHRHNFHNMKRYRERRTNAIYEMMAILEHLGIKNEDLTLPIRKLN